MERERSSTPCDRFAITVRGRAAHGSAPHQGRDAIVAAAYIHMALQTLVSRVNDPRDGLELVLESVAGGHNFNIIADTAVMRGYVADYGGGFCTGLLADMATAIAAAHGCEAEVAWQPPDASMPSR